MEKFKEIFIHSWIKYVVSLVLSTGIMIAYCAIRGEWGTKSYYSNGLFIGSFLVIAIGLMALLNNYGAYDIWQYVFTGKRKKEHITLAEYSEMKEKARKKSKYEFVPFVTTGLIMLGISALLLL